MTVMMVMSVMMTMMIMIMIHEPMCPHPKNPLFKGSDWRTHCVREGLDVGLLQQPTVEILQPNAFDSILFTLKYGGALLLSLAMCIVSCVPINGSGARRHMAEPGALYKHSFVTREANEGRYGGVTGAGVVGDQK